MKPGKLLKAEKKNEASENWKARDGREEQTDFKCGYMRQEVGERKDDHTMTSAVWWSHVVLRGLSHMEASAATMELESHWALTMNHSNPSKQTSCITDTEYMNFQYQNIVNASFEQNNPNQQPA